MTVAERVVAGLTLAVCLVLLVRMLLKPNQRDRLDRVARDAWERMVRGARRLRQRKAAPPPNPAEAARVAEEAIRRAKEGSWQGNVYTPKSFRKPRKPH